VKNGELLALAAKQFGVFITIDRNLSFQQNLPKFDIAVIILRAHSDRPHDLRPFGARAASSASQRETWRGPRVRHLTAFEQNFAKSRPAVT